MSEAAKAKHDSQPETMFPFGQPRSGEGPSFAKVLFSRLRLVEKEPKSDASSKDMIPRDVPDGIIANLTRTCGGNIYKQGIIDITASSCGGPIENVVEPGKCFISLREPNPWISYDFKGLHVSPTSYSITTADWGFPMSWVFEVSNDGSEGSWEVVDRRDNNCDLKGKYVTHIFEISPPLRRSFRFVRLRQTERTHDGHDVLYIALFEVFGEITEIPSPIAVPQEFLFDELKPLDGIIAHLTRECGGNVHKMGVIEVTASSVHTPWSGAENVVDLGTREHFFSKNEPNQWIMYDFKGRRVSPTSYSAMTFSVRGMSWVFEVSNEGSEGSWQVVDRSDGQEPMMKPFTIRNFAISDPPRESFRFVRFRQTGKSENRRDFLELCALEIFGTLSS